MKKVKYLVQRILDIDYKNLFRVLSSLHKKTGKSYIFLIYDIMKCGMKHGAGYMDYSLFEMYNMTEEIRSTIMTRGRNNELIAKYNQKAYIDIFHNKGKFDEKFNRYLKRDWIVLDGINKESCIEFLKNHDEVFVKPIGGSCGKRMRKCLSSELLQSYDELVMEKPLLLEEMILQDQKMDLLYAGAVNTIRIVSINDHKKINIVVAYVRIGNGSFVDNFNHGGMVAPVSEKTGIILAPAVDKSGNVYEKHPITGTTFENFQIPCWKQVIKLVNELAKQVPEVGMVGWDIAISKKGPVVVEGNEFPGHDIYNLPAHRKDGSGVYPKFLKIKKE